MGVFLDQCIHSSKITPIDFEVADGSLEMGAPTIRERSPALNPR